MHKINDTITFLCYGKPVTSQIVRLSRDGSILFLSNKMWCHAVSVIKGAK